MPAISLLTPVPRPAGDSSLSRAHSAALSRLEIQVTGLLEEGSTLGSELERRGRARAGKQELARRLGCLSNLRYALEALGDFQDVGDAQRTAQLAARRALLEARLTLIEATTRTALELWKNQRSNALEWAIVILIVVDIVLVVVGH